MIFVRRRSLPTDEGRLTKWYSARRTQVRSCGLPKLWFSAAASWHDNSPRRKIQHVRVRDFTINSALLLWTLLLYAPVTLKSGGDVTSARRSLGSRRSERQRAFLSRGAFNIGDKSPATLYPSEHKNSMSPSDPIINYMSYHLLIPLRVSPWEG